MGRSMMQILVLGNAIGFHCAMTSICICAFDAIGAHICILESGERNNFILGPIGFPFEAGADAGTKLLSSARLPSPALSKVAVLPLSMHSSVTLYTFYPYRHAR